jgi:hypothetical protein
MSDDGTDGALLGRCQLWRAIVAQSITTAMIMDTTAYAPPASGAIEKVLSVQRYAYSLCQLEQWENVDIGQWLHSAEWYKLENEP